MILDEQLYIDELLISRQSRPSTSDLVLYYA
nr:MAG TPA: hypothetical protein [Bacteriophage sp.]